MSTRLAGRCPVSVSQLTRLDVLTLMVLMLQMGCATSTPSRGLLEGGYHYRPQTPHDWGARPSSNSGVGAREQPTPTRRQESVANHQEETRERVRRVEQARAVKLVLAAQREGRNPDAAREAEADRALARVVGLCNGVEEVGATLVFNFWAEGGPVDPPGMMKTAEQARKVAMRELRSRFPGLE